MPRLSERGFAHLLLLLLLGAGLVATVYLVTSGNPLKLFSKATVSQPVGPEVSFTLVGPSPCSGLMCLLPGNPQPQEEFSVKLYARSDIETANLFTARINFPKDVVEVKEIQTAGSFIQNWVEEYYDNETGYISLSGGVPAPGYQTQTGGESSLMATIVLKAKTIGTGPMNFSDSSSIYSNLNNINILTTKRGYDISVEVPPPSPTPTVVPSPSPAPPPLCATVPGLTYSTSINCKTDWITVSPAYINCPTDPMIINLLNNSCNISSQPCYGKRIDYYTAPNGGAPLRGNLLNNECGGPTPVEIRLHNPFPTPTPTPTTRGDGNGDGVINLVDMSILHSSFPPPTGSGNPNYRATVDMNNDGFIRTNDFLALRGLLIQLGVIRVRPSS